VTALVEEGKEGNDQTPCFAFQELRRKGSEKEWRHYCHGGTVLAVERKKGKKKKEEPFPIPGAKKARPAHRLPTKACKRKKKSGRKLRGPLWIGEREDPRVSDRTVGCKKSVDVGTLSRDVGGRGIEGKGSQNKNLPLRL